MENLRDPRDMFSEVVVPAKQYLVHNSIGPDLMLKSIEDEEKLVLTRNPITMKINPLLHETGLFDTVTVEKRVSAQVDSLRLRDQEKLSPITFPLITVVRKATRKEILEHIPAALGRETDQARVITLDDYLEEANYVAPVLQTTSPKFQPAQPEEFND